MWKISSTNYDRFRFRRSNRKNLGISRSVCEGFPDRLYYHIELIILTVISYFKINPNGRVPTLVHHRKDGKDFTVFESAAIILYLARIYDTEHKFSESISSWALVRSC